VTVSGYPSPYAPGSPHSPTPEPRYLMYVSGVALLIPPDHAPEGAGAGQEALRGLALGADQSGLAVLGPRPGEHRLVPWRSIGGIGSNGFASLASGLSGYSLTLALGQRTIEFVLPVAGVGAGGIGELVAVLSSLRDRFAGYGGGYGTSDASHDVGYPGYGSGREGYGGSYASYPNPYTPLSAPAVGQVRLVSRSRLPSLLAVVASLVVLLGGGSVAWYLTGGESHPSGKPASHTSSNASNASPGLEAIAEGANLTLADMPAGWVVARSAGSGPGLTKANEEKVLDQFAACLGVRRSSLLGAFGVQPAPGEVDAGSPTFTTVGQALDQVMSASSIEPSPSVVESGLMIIDEHQFASCSAQEIVTTAGYALQGKALVQGGGPASLHPLPPFPMVSGASLTVPILIVTPGGSATIYVNTAFMASERMEGTLSVIASPGSVPPGFFVSLTTTLEHRLANAAREVGARVSAE